MKGRGVGVRGNAKLAEVVFSLISGFVTDSNVLVKDKAYFLCNLDYDGFGRLRGRKKLRKLVDLPLAHSPFSLGDGLFLVCSCQGNDKLYLFNRNTLELRLLTDLPTVYARYWYVRYRDKVYISNKYWNGVLELGSYSIRNWRADVVELREVFEGSDYFFADVEPMPKVSYLSFLAGRVLGVRDNVVYYTEALYPDIYRSVNRIVFPSEIRKLMVLEGENSIIILLDGRIAVGKLVDVDRFIFNFVYYDRDVYGGLVVGAEKKTPLFFVEDGLIDLGGRPISFVGKRVFDVDREKFSGDVEGRVGGRKLYGVPDLSFSDGVIVEVIKKSEKP